MKESALTLSNYFIEIAQKDGKSLRPLRLMKLVYLSYAYCLVYLDKNVLNPRFDKVEAWKLGPVIPSVYHSFKDYGNKPITHFTEVFTGTTEMDDGEELASLYTPRVHDEDVKSVCLLVWGEFSSFTDGQIVDFLHKDGSPWQCVYKEGENARISDNLTKEYFSKLLSGRTMGLRDDFTYEDTVRFCKETAQARVTSLKSAWLND